MGSVDDRVYKIPCVMKEPRVMETDRLALRALTAADASLLAELYSDPEVARYVGGAELDSVAAERQAQQFASVWNERGYGQSIVCDRFTGAVIGRVGLHPWEEWGEVELGWVLARSHQGRGLAQEAALAWLDWGRRERVAPAVTAVIQPDNVASVRLAERLGFLFERSEQAFGNPVSVYRYGFA